jgi:hypothetical protein
VCFFCMLYVPRLALVRSDANTQCEGSYFLLIDHIGHLVSSILTVLCILSQGDEPHRQPVRRNRDLQGTVRASAAGRKRREIGPQRAPAADTGRAAPGPARRGK